MTRARAGQGALAPLVGRTIHAAPRIESLRIDSAVSTARLKRNAATRVDDPLLGLSSPDAIGEA